MTIQNPIYPATSWTTLSSPTTDVERFRFALELIADEGLSHHLAKKVAAAALREDDE